MSSWKEMTSNPREVREEVKKEIEVEKKPDDLESAIDEALKKYGGKPGVEVDAVADDERRRTAIEMLKSGEGFDSVVELLKSSEIE